MRRPTNMDHVTTGTPHRRIRHYFLAVTAVVMGLSCSSCEAGAPAGAAGDSAGLFFEHSEFDTTLPSQRDGGR